MKCPKCNTEIKVDSGSEGTNSYSPVNPKLDSLHYGFTIPFCCDYCGAIQFKYKAIRDVVFLYPTPKPEKIGSIHLPDYDGRSWNTQEFFREATGVVLSLGKGAYDKKGKWHPSNELEIGDLVYYEKRVPWRMDFLAPDGKEYTVILCGYKDVYLRVNEAVHV